MYCVDLYNGLIGGNINKIFGTYLTYHECTS